MTSFDKNSIKNKKMFDLAKNEGEVAFIEVMNASVYKPIAISQAFDDDDKIKHFDVMMLEYDIKLKSNTWHYVDVKDVEEKNFNTGNYVLRKPFIEFHTDLKPYGYYIAFRLVENNKRSNKFILANTQEMLAKCTLIDKNDYMLVPLKEVLEKCKCKKIEEECI